GKNLILRHMAGRNEDKLTALKGSVGKLGYISEVKSVISEFMQYGVGDSELGKLIEKSESRGVLKDKLTDIRLLYGEFLKYINEKYITTEEILGKVRDEVPRSKKLKKSVIVLDGYTGFTPVQRGLIEELLVNCVDLYMTLLTDTYDRGGAGDQDLFCLSSRTLEALDKMCRDREIARKEDVVLKGEVPARFMYDDKGGVIPEDKRRHALIHLEKNLFRPGGKICKRIEGDDSLQLFCGTDPLEEAVETAVRIERLVREEGYHYKDIAVVTGDLDTYMNVCARAFARYDIPFFVDKKTPILLNPMIEYIRGLFDILLNDHSYESMFRYLRSRVSGYDRADVDVLENYVLRYGIRGRKAWKGKFVKKPRNMEETDLERINEIRDGVACELEGFYRDLSDDPKEPGRIDPAEDVFDVRVVSTALYRFLSERKLQEKMEAMRTSFEEAGDRVRAMEYSRTYEDVCNLLDKMVRLLPGEKMTLKEYASLLDAGFAEIRTGVLPSSDDHVQIGDITRTRLRDIKALFFMGVNDGVIPARGGNGGIISDMEREFLTGDDGDGGIELAPTARRKAYDQRLYLYMLTTKPMEHLYVSYSRLDTKGDSINPSYLVKILLKMFPDTVIQEPDEGVDNRVYGYGSAHLNLALRAQDMLTGLTDDNAFDEYIKLLDNCLNDDESRMMIRKFMRDALKEGPIKGTDKISRAVAHALYGSDLNCSITRLETYAKCAYSHFMQYGLSLKEREVFSFEPSDMGNIFHDALKEYAAILNERGLSWTGISDEETGDYIREAVERSLAAGDYSAVYGSFRTGYAVNRMNRIMKRTVGVLTDHLKKGSFTPSDHEFDFAIGGNVRLIGRVDRMDLCTEEGNTYVKIIDYKSGNRKFDLISVYAGLDLQLLVYLNAGMELISRRYEGNRVIPAGIFYYHIDDPIIDEEETGPMDDDERIREKILDKFIMSGLVNADETVYRLMDNELDNVIKSKSRIIPVALKKDGDFASNSSVASEEEFGILGSYVNYKIEETGNEILEGNIKAEPHKSTRSHGLPCDYCDYGDVCGYRGDGVCLTMDDLRNELEKAGITDVDPHDEMQVITELMKLRTKRGNKSVQS
ncbi:MAG: PD-(D/E)XK nuclease family protein, partial [Lachnospiraceae bacterium]|nr:PD-(D/E)XK nuclease family protein [Lachnospiraceae bacterium]